MKKSQNREGPYPVQIHRSFFHLFINPIKKLYFYYIQTSQTIKLTNISFAFFQHFPPLSDANFFFRSFLSNYLFKNLSHVSTSCAPDTRSTYDASSGASISNIY